MVNSGENAVEGSGTCLNRGDMYLTKSKDVNIKMYCEQLWNKEKDGINKTIMKEVVVMQRCDKWV